MAPSPKQIELSPEQADSLIESVRSKRLDEKDYEILIGIIETVLLLYQTLSQKSHSIQRLLRRIFGTKTESAKNVLGRLCPDGIDVYYENVGGSHLEAALDNMNPFGRIVLCGMISQYNATNRESGPGNLFLAITKRLTLKGFIVSDHMERQARFYSDMGKWIKEGRIKWKETIREGIENAPKAFLDLFKGKNLGKMLVKIGPDPAEPS